MYDPYETDKPENKYYFYVCEDCGWHGEAESDADDLNEPDECPECKSCLLYLESDYE